MQSPPPLDGPRPPTSFLSLPFELRDQIYRLALRSLPRIRPMLSSPTVPTYRLQGLDPRPLFVHPQLQHEIEALLASRTRIQIPPWFGVGGEPDLSDSTLQWLREGTIEFRRIRVWSGLPLPIILDVDVLAGAEVAVRYKWRLTGGRWRLYSWGRHILEPALPVMFDHLVEELRRRVGARGGTGVGIREIEFLMESMGRFRDWFGVHRRFRSRESRLSAGSYEGELDGLRYSADENKEDFRRCLEWWDGVEAEVRDLKKTQSRVLA